MIHVLNALDKMATWMHMVAQGGSPLGGAYLTKGAMDDLAKARETVTTTVETVTEDEVPEDDAPASDDVANDLNKAEADANAEKAAAMAAGLAHR